MRKPNQRRWWPLWALGGYIAWDIADHTVLQSRGLWGGFALDWGIAGAIALTAWLVAEHRQRQQAQAQARSNHASPAPKVAAAIQHTLGSLDTVMRDINDSAGLALSSEGIDQQRQLRQLIVAVHHAQSNLDELHGLMAAPRMNAPPPPQELYERPGYL